MVKKQICYEHRRHVLCWTPMPQATVTSGGSTVALLATLNFE